MLTSVPQTPDVTRFTSTSSGWGEGAGRSSMRIFLSASRTTARKLDAALELSVDQLSYLLERQESLGLECALFDGGQDRSHLLVLRRDTESLESELDRGQATALAVYDPSRRLSHDVPVVGEHLGGIVLDAALVPAGDDARLDLEQALSDGRSVGGDHVPRPLPHEPGEAIELLRVEVVVHPVQHAQCQSQFLHRAISCTLAYPRDGCVYDFDAGGDGR